MESAQRIFIDSESDSSDTLWHLNKSFQFKKPERILEGSFIFSMHLRDSFGAQNIVCNTVGRQIKWAAFHSLSQETEM